MSIRCLPFLFNKKGEYMAIEKHILRLGNTGFLVLVDEDFIFIEYLPYQYQKRKFDYDPYFISLFKYYISIFRSICVDVRLPHPLPANQRYLVNFISPITLHKVMPYIPYIINTRLYK